VTGDEIRQAFLEFFQDRGHKVLPSSSLIPYKDPTLLLTSAGMVQIKPYFLGLEAPPSPRLASCQKCFRATDIDSVGDSKHLTFFEMLGNFSVGDYFKKEAISWAWEFVTKYLKLPKERLWITIYLDDDEAFTYWQEVGVPSQKILRFGEEDNFWGPVGDSGPCGPCSEIHYDLGEEFGCGRPECKPNCECGRFSEIWNLVFTQYNQDSNGQRTPLPKPNIDTGMGLERTAAATQGKPSPYETELFSPLVKQICQLVNRNYGEDENTDRAIRIIAEHGRGIVFLIADGVMPSNEGRGYVLQRILKRASVYGKRLGLDKPFLSQITEVVISQMSDIYPELTANRDLIRQVVEVEEEKFQQTLPIGMGILEQTLFRMREELVGYLPIFKKAFEKAISQKDIIDLTHKLDAAIDHFLRDCKAWKHVLGIGYRDAVVESLQPVEKDLTDLKGIVSGYDPFKLPDAFDALKRSLREGLERLEDDLDSVANELTGFEVFILHDTYGFLQELTAEIARERDLSIDWESFQAEMEKQRERARAGHRFVTASDRATGHEGARVEYIPEPTEFTGYDSLESRSKISYLLDQDSGIAVSLVEEGKLVAIVLDKTPFYAEMGGQVGDLGRITCHSGWADIARTVWSPFGNLAAGAIVHLGQVVNGRISVGDEVEAKIDAARRLDIARNHTATHLLQLALRQVLGSRVQQRGSLVEPERLRFDFSHLAAITEEQLMEVQRRVNEKVRQNLPVKAKKDIPYGQAIAEGALAFFEEKYGEMVRVIEIGEPPISKELCGGTHVKSTGEIGLFFITNESSIGTGLRRIQAVTGRAAESLVEERLSALQNIAKEVESPLEETHDKVKTLLSELETEHRRTLCLERELSRKVAESLLEQVEKVDGVTVLAAKVPPLTILILREMGDILRDKLKSAIVVLATVYDNKPNFVAMVTPDLAAKGFHAGDIIREVAKVTGGGGGGKATMAQAGGKDIAKLNEALISVKSVIAKQISSTSTEED